MSVDMRIPGDPTAVTGIADWLDHQLAGPLVDVDVESANVRSQSEHLWEGQAGAAFRDTLYEVTRRTRDLPGYLRDIAEVLRAYAGRLQRGQEDFESLLGQAPGVGLEVRGTLILPPTTWLVSCPIDTSPENERDEWERYEQALATYDTVSEHVGTWWSELELWIAENLAPLTTRLEEFSDLDALLQGLAVGNEDVLTTTLDFVQETREGALTDLRVVAEQAGTDAQTFTDQLRSGNPAVRSAAEAADPDGIRRQLSVLNDAISDAARFSKVIPVVGVVVDVVAAGTEIADGGSPTSVGLGVAGGAGGAALAGWALAGVAIPPLGAVLIVGGVAVVAGSAATWLWEAAVPLDARETIDDFLVGTEPVLVSGGGSWIMGGSR
jgi:hypothetical protein